MLIKQLRRRLERYRDGVGMFWVLGNTYRLHENFNMEDPRPRWVGLVVEVMQC